MHPTLLLALLALPLTACTSGPRPTGLPEPKLNVGFLLLDGIYGSELVAPHDVFHHVRFHVDRDSKTGPMEVFTVGRDSSTVTSFEGLRIQPDYTLEDAPRIDVLVVPSAEHNMDSDLADRRLIEWITRRGRDARWTLSLCDGAFVLAEAGLLDGRRCTTFPGDIPAFRKRYPQLAVTENVSFVVDGGVVTSAGGAKSYDAALFVVETIYDQKIAEGVARGIVIDWTKEAIDYVVADDTPSAKEGARPMSWLPGETVTAIVEDGAGTRVALEELLRDQSCKGAVLFLVAGAEGGDTRKRGGLWCEDSFNDLPLLRHLRLQYEDKGIRFIPVCCPPVYHEEEFGYTEGAFLHRPDDDPVYRDNRQKFVARTQRLVDEDVLPFSRIWFDPRFRMLSNPLRGEASVGERPDWQGKFKWYGDTQAYGTPTLWILDRERRVFGKPFHMNVYESEGRRIRYTTRDVSSRLDRLVRQP